MTDDRLQPRARMAVGRVALARYDQARLAAAIRHVRNSEQETAAYLAHAAAAGRRAR